MINAVECPQIKLVPTALMLEQFIFVSLDIIKTNKRSIRKLAAELLTVTKMPLENYSAFLENKILK